MARFIHLHNHSDYSLLDGAVPVKKLVSRAKKLGMSHIALTDHGNMFGAIAFYKECMASEITPIIGSEFYVAPDSRHNKSASDTKARTNHLILLATDETGYKNLLKLSSTAFIEGFYYKPRIDMELLTKHSKGLIALTACLAGAVPSLVLDRREEEAEKKALMMNELFGKGRFYLEMQDHGIPEQKIVNRALVEISRKTGIPLVATNDVHYLEREDARAQDILICIGTGKKISDEKRLHFDYQDFYLKTPDEMSEIFSGYPEAIGNTVKIAEMCNLKIPLPGPELPDYAIPEGYTLKSYFYETGMKGLAERYREITPEIKNRFDYEISIIDTMNFTGYFLIVWDFIKFAKEHGIPVGPGRGSGAGSIVAYALRITDIDPLKYNLLFERFLNPERISMPDFDVDFCFERRGEVIDYVTRKYGKERVSQIITFGTLKTKAVIKDVARVLEFPFEEANAISKLIPFEKDINLTKAVELEPKLKELVEKGDRYRELYDISSRLEDLKRHASTHAAGIVIGKRDLMEYVPLYKDPKTDAISTQYSMEYLEECGLVKMDFLGLKTLTLIQNTVKLIRKRGIDIDPDNIPENDAATFKLLGQGKSTCIFQFESTGMQDILKRAKPGKIEDLIALNALYRPGPMEFIDQFIESKSDKSKIQYPLPALESVLKETYGVIVYQEQVMEIARIVGGYSLGQADILRRAMGKKKVDVMAKQKEKFVKGAIDKGYSEKDAERIFDLLIPFAGYGFNKSHAAAYSVLAYKTAYLKANYPAEFMAANLTNEIHDTDKLSEYILETRGMGIEITPPDINLSDVNFSVTDGKIVYGLLGIKNAGGAVVDAIVNERTQNGPYADIHDFLERVDLKVANRKVLETLVRTGVFDSLGENRATLFANIDKLLDSAHRKKELAMYGQASLFDSVEDSGFEELEIARLQEYPKKQLLDWEKENLGFFFSGHPLDEFRKAIKSHTNINLARAEDASSDKEYSLIGVLKNVKEIITKTGKKMAFGLMEDYNGSIELVIFSDVFEKYRDILVNDQVLAVKGKIDLSRGEPKMIVNGFMEVKSIVEEEQAYEKPAKAIHILLSGKFYMTENLSKLKGFCEEKKGNCSLYLHPESADGENGTVIKAGNGMKVACDDEFLEALRHFPQVMKVWKE